MKATVKQSKRKRGEEGISLTFKLSEDFDSAHVFLDDGDGQPGGFAFSNADGRELILYVTTPKGVYAWTVTARRAGQDDEEVKGTVTVK